MADIKYIQSGSSSSNKGNGYLSKNAFSKIAEAALEELPNVALDKKQASSGNIVNIVLNTEISTTFAKSGKPTIDFGVLIRKGENATTLCKELQEEVADQILSLTEIPEVNLNIHIDGIFQ